MLLQYSAGKEDTHTEWTDEKHSLYLKSMEASFVDQLYNSLGLLGSKNNKDTVRPSSRRFVNGGKPSEEQVWIIRHFPLSVFHGRCEMIMEFSFFFYIFFYISSRFFVMVSGRRWTWDNLSIVSVEDTVVVLTSFLGAHGSSTISLHQRPLKIKLLAQRV